MKLSMSMILEQLRPFTVEAVNIEGDEAAILGLRVFPNQNEEFSDDFVYVGRHEAIFDDARTDSFLVAHGTNSIYVRDCSYDDLINTLLGAFDYYNTWENSLLRAIASDASPEQIVNLCTPMVANPLLLATMYGEIIALSAEGGGSPVNPRSPDLEDPFLRQLRKEGEMKPGRLLFHTDGRQMKDFSSKPEIFFSEHEDEAPIIGCYLQADDENIAAFVIVLEDASKSHADLRLAERLCEILPSASAFQGSEAHYGSTSSIVKRILDEQDVDDAQLAAFTSGSCPESPWQLLVLKHMTRTDLAIKNDLVRKLRKMGIPCIPVVFDDGVAVIVASAAVPHFLDYLEARIAINRYAGGLSMPFADMRTLPLRYRQALFAIERDEAPGIRNCKDYAVGFLLERLRTRDKALDLVHPALSILSEYDRHHKAAGLYETLFLYLKYEGNISELTERLCIHRNSLAYRLKRIRELSGITLDDYDENIYLLLSFLIEGMI